MSESDKTEGGKKATEDAGEDASQEIEAETAGTPEEDTPGEAGRPSPFGDVEGLSATPEELPEAEEEISPSAKPRRGRRLIVVLVLLLVVFLAGLLAWPLLAPRLSAYLPAGLVFGGVMADKVEALESRMSEVEAKAGRLDPSIDFFISKAGDTANTLAAHDTRIAALEGADPSARLNELAGRIEGLQGAASQRDEQLASQVAELTARLAALETGLAREGGEGPEAGAAVAAALQRIAAVERALGDAQDRNQDLASRLAAMEETAAQQARDLAAQTERIAGLEEKTAAQVVAQKAAMSGDARGAALVLAVGQLRAALKSSAPFARELAALDPIAADAGEGVQEPLDALRPLAVAGVPTLAVLQARFDETASAVVRAGIAEGDDWMSRTMARLSSLITVRRTGEVAGDDAAAVVARAEQRLGEGDLAAAVAELESLSGTPAEAAAGWLAEARRRLAADTALEGLHAAAVATLGR